MSEQRMKILEMLEAKKITVEEAALLLRAVSGTGPAPQAASQAPPRGSANGRRGIGIGEPHARVCQAIDVRSQSLWVPFHTADPVIQIVHRDKQNIALLAEKTGTAKFHKT